MNNPVWKPLIAKLDLLAEEERIARFWLRDDDAVEPTAALAEFLQTVAASRVCVTLAVIPENTGQALATCLDNFPGVTVAVHGWSHRNYAPVTEKKQELGPHRPAADVLGELSKGFVKLQDLHGTRFVPMLVPPWNRIDAALLDKLPGHGFKAISTYGPERAGPIRALNTHVDVIDWRGTGSGKPIETLVADIVTRLADIENTEGVVGILTHHLVHDEQVKVFLRELFDLTGDHPACNWLDMQERLSMPE